MSTKVVRAKAEPEEPLWDKHFYDVILPEHAKNCDHYISAFGEHCTCGMLKRLLND